MLGFYDMASAICVYMDQDSLYVHTWWCCLSSDVKLSSGISTVTSRNAFAMTRTGSYHPGVGHQQGNLAQECNVPDFTE